jgi:hypothetical protein
VSGSGTGAARGRNGSQRPFGNAPSFGRHSARRIIGFLQPRPVCLPDRRGLLGREDALRQKPFLEAGARGGVRVDCRVGERLREARLIQLVVAVAAVADEVDDGVAREALAEGDG